MSLIHKIFDAHSHVHLDEYSLMNYVKSHLMANITRGIIMIDPYINEIKCSTKKHHSIIRQNKKGQEAICVECQKPVAQNSNFYRQYNLKLLQCTQSLKEQGFTPFPFITTIANTYAINNEVDFFLNSNLPFYGIKIYTGTSADVLNKCTFNSDYPLIIHTGLWENQFPKTMLQFCDRYRGPILIAHFAMFDLSFIKELKNKPNIYFDTSPAICAYQRYVINKNNGGFINSDGIEYIEDMYYKLIDLVGLDKIIWGSDYPIGNVSGELKIVQGLNINDIAKQALLYGNAMRFLE